MNSPGYPGSTHVQLPGVWHRWISTHEPLFFSHSQLQCSAAQSTGEELLAEALELLVDALLALELLDDRDSRAVELEDELPVEELLGLLALLLEEDDELTDLEEDVEADDTLWPPTWDTLLELELDELLDEEGELNDELLELWIAAEELDELVDFSEDHEENVLDELVDELAEWRIAELVEVLVDGELSVELDRLEEELVEALRVDDDEELLVPAGLPLELDVEDQESRAVELEELLVEAEDHEEVDALDALDRLDVLEVEDEDGEELDMLDSSRSPETPSTASSTSMLALTPEYRTRKRLAAAVQGNPS